MKINIEYRHFLTRFWKEEHRMLAGFILAAGFAFLVSLISLTIFFGLSSRQTKQQLTLTQKQKEEIQKAYILLKNQDQFKRNETLQATISAIEKTYNESVNDYQNILDLQAQKVDVSDDLTLFTNNLAFLSKRNYTSAEATLSTLDDTIASQQQKLAAASTPQVPNLPTTTSNTPPGSGFNVQAVTTDRGTFPVSIIAADMGSTKVVVDTASNGDCSNNCPTLPLDAFVSRSGAYAGIDGNFFCPAEYPSCAGKTGSFDLLVMNKNKVYFNSSNNVYSTNPAVIFGNGFVRFVGQALQWGRDTSVDGVLSNFPLLVSGENVIYTDNGDTKFTNKGSRGFVANKGNTVFIGYVFNANMTDAAFVLKSLGMDNAMNLDEGGSTALWYGGYKAGPGRNIPDAILFLRK